MNLHPCHVAGNVLKASPWALFVYTLAQSALDSIGSYSASEVATPFKWTDGKVIYKKTVSGTGPASAGSVNIPHGITGMTKLIKYEGVADAGGSYISLNRVWNPPSVSAIDVVINSTNIAVTSNTATAWQFTFTLYYTK